MLNDITTFDVLIIDLFWLTLTDMLPWLRGITWGAALGCVIVPSCAYVLMAAACRMRYGTGTEISGAWSALYLSVAACAVLVLLSAIYGQARVVDALLALTMAAYVHITAPAWRTGVPPVAKAKTPPHTPTPHTAKDGL